MDCRVSSRCSRSPGRSPSSAWPTISIDAFGHGLALDPATETSVRAALHAHGLDPFGDRALHQPRARPRQRRHRRPRRRSRTGNAFHTRDVVRQAVVDWMQLVRLLRTFDGTGSMVIGTTNAKAGDFNVDGVPDVGGPSFFPFAVTKLGGTVRLFEKGDCNPGADLFAFGQSFGGTVAAILPALEPGIVAAAPVSAAGGLADRAGAQHAARHRARRLPGAARAASSSPAISIRRPVRWTRRRELTPAPAPPALPTPSRSSSRT